MKKIFYFTLIILVGFLLTNFIFNNNVLAINNSTIYEAEKTTGVGTVIASEHPGYTGTGFVDYSPNEAGGYLKWTVNVTVPGKYLLQFRYASGASEDRPAKIEVNNKVVKSELSFEPTSAWNNWEKTSCTVDLKKGENEIKAIAIGNSGGANIDHLKVSYAYDEIYEAEKATGVGTVTASEHPGYTGTGFVDYKPNKAGGYLEWKVNIPIGGNYKLNFHYASGASENRPAEIKVNNKIVVKALAFNPTGAWNNWENTGTIVQLKKGENIIRATAVGSSGGANIDHLNILSESLAHNEQDPLNSEIKTVVLEKLLNKTLLKFLQKQGLIAEGEVVPYQNRTAEKVKIVSAQAITTDKILVTLGGCFANFDVNDLKIAAPTNDWSALSPDINHYFSIKKAAVTENAKGQTVVVYQLNKKMNKNARIYLKEGQKIVMDKEAAREAAFKLVSWQMDHGGWTKSMDNKYKHYWNGKEKRTKQFGPFGRELGSIDNGATITPMRFIAKVYKVAESEKLQISFLKGLDFLLAMQYPSGGFPQVYPVRATPEERVYYSNFVTFNDNAMVNVLNMFDDILDRKFPFNSDLVSKNYRKKIKKSMEKAIDYILKSQIKVDGKLTAWCAQHHPETYEPMYARSYEHPSISGSESVGIVKFLMDRKEKTPEIRKAINSAIRWFKEVNVEDTKYIRNDPKKEFFYPEKGSNIWYRFYDIETVEPIFSGRDGVIKRNLKEIEEERQYGYSWAGSYPQALLDVVDSVGYYGRGEIYVKVTANKSNTVNNKKLKIGDLKMVEKIKQDADQVITKMVVAEDGSGDYEKVQTAINAVPENNLYPVEIFIKDGIYKEVIEIGTSKPFIHMIGESKENTVITYDNYNGKTRSDGGTYGTTGSSTAFLYGDNFKAKNITFQNSYDRKEVGKNAQAVAVKSQGDKMYFKNVRFLGQQDTLYANDGRQYFENCYIEGDVDFIFGAAQAVFNNCQIHSLDRGSEINNGYITAASTSIKDKYGYLFVDCEFTSDAPKNTVFLGRPWHPGGDPDVIASVVIKNSQLGAHIKDRAWTEMSGFSPEEARFYEYNNSGPGAEINDNRESLTDKEAEQYTIENVLDGWVPGE